MKVAEKSNGSVQSTTERKDEVILNPSLNGKSPNGAIEAKSKNDAVKAAEGKKVEVVNEVKETEKSKEFKPVLNLEATLKVVDDLHRRSIQRVNLLSRINQLEDFEIALIEEGDELETNHFQGCQLIISDDKGRKFVTRTAGLIRLVAEFIHSACLAKLGEIEANIVFPRP
ncbi:hypothetical protein ABIB40_002901 [Pedobacter sp. UYP30]|uniref:hypothetical protein n=1 Tax=Pedobacter sp. UYP30 TaxID=1756400 RepID=UPI0033927A2A